MVAYLDGVLADAESVPQLDGSVHASTHNLSVVHAEGHAHHIASMSLELLRSLPTEQTIHKLNDET